MSAASPTDSTYVSSTTGTSTLRPSTLPRRNHERTHRDRVLPSPDPRPRAQELLGKLLDFIQAEFPEAVDEVKDYAFWKLRKEKAHDVAKITEIKSEVVEKLGNLELERQRLLIEREEKQRAADLADAVAKHRHALELRAAKEASLEKLIAALRYLKDLGVTLDA